ncbi:hypothetical protein [Methylomagnum sp.]
MLNQKNRVLAVAATLALSLADSARAEPLTPAELDGVTAAGADAAVVVVAQAAGDIYARATTTGATTVGQTAADNPVLRGYFAAAAGTATTLTLGNGTSNTAVSPTANVPSGHGQSYTVGGGLTVGGVDITSGATLKFSTPLLPNRF